MDDAILITELNDFIFCPASIYFHKVYGNMETMLYQSSDQINGTAAHEKVDNASYTTKADTLMGLDVFCEKYNLIGKIDIYDKARHILRERKKRIKQIFPGYIYQVYAQCFALREMGYIVDKIELYSMDDHKTYGIELPENDAETLKAFEDTVGKMHSFDMNDYIQTNEEKCKHCIYEPACDRSLVG